MSRAVRWFSPSFRGAVRERSLGVALTGATSWLGRAFLATLSTEDCLPSPDKLRLFASSSRTTRAGGKTFAVERLSDAAPLGDGPWLLLHFAFLGKEHTSMLAPRDFMTGNEAILDDVLRIAASVEDLRFVFSSSGAVYGAKASVADGLTPDPYGVCKSEHETRIAGWCADRNIPLVVPRIFNIGGPCINKTGSYALSCFIQDAIAERAICISARRPTYRSYVHVAELLGLTADLALGQNAGTPFFFDTAGCEIVEMADLALAVSRAFPTTSVAIERPALDTLTADRYVGDGACYQRMLNAYGRSRTPLPQIIADTAADLASRDG